MEANINSNPNSKTKPIKYINEKCYQILNENLIKFKLEIETKIFFENEAESKCETKLEFRNEINI